MFHAGRFLFEQKTYLCETHNTYFYLLSHDDN